MANADHNQLGIPAADIVAWTRAFVRHPSPQTERFEQEPQAISWSSSGPSVPTGA